MLLCCGEATDTAYYSIMREKYRDSINGNELFSIPEALTEVATRAISLLATDVKSRKFVGASREDMEEVLKCLKLIHLALRSNVTWDGGGI